MVSLENFIDKQLFLVIRDVKTLSSTGLDQDHLLVTLRGYEERQGIWVEVGELRPCPVKVEGETLESCPAIVFIPWYHIVSIVHFPGKENLELNLPKTKKVGFRQD